LKSEGKACHGIDRGKKNGQGSENEHPPQVLTKASRRSSQKRNSKAIQINTKRGECWDSAAARDTGERRANATARVFARRPRYKRKKGRERGNCKKA